MKVGLELGGSGYGKVSLHTKEMRNGEHILILDIDEHSSILGEDLPRTRSDEMICGDVYLDMDEVQQLRTYLNVLHNSGLLREALRDGNDARRNACEGTEPPHEPGRPCY